MDSVAGRTNQVFLLGKAVACAAAICCLLPKPLGAVEGEKARPVATVDFPVASDMRMAGDNKRTRFILDLDKSVPFRAFSLADPYRVVLDLPQVTFRLAPGAGATGR